jgi:hypothetical protein
MMGIEELYIRIKKLFGVVDGYLDNKALGSIFKMCRLKPLDVLLAKDKSPKTNLYTHWVDEWHNSLMITSNKRIRLVMNDLSIPIPVKTDIYGGLSIGRTARISKLVYATPGCEWVAFLGIDNYLRAFIRMDEYEPCSPLSLRMEHLYRLEEHKDDTCSQQIYGSSIIILPASKEMIYDLDAHILWDAITKDGV